MDFQIVIPVIAISFFVLIIVAAICIPIPMPSANKAVENVKFVKSGGIPDDLERHVVYQENIVLRGVIIAKDKQIDYLKAENKRLAAEYGSSIGHTNDKGFSTNFRSIDEEWQ